MNRLQKFPTCTILYVGLFFGFLLFSNKVHARNNFNFNTQPNFSYSTGLKVYSADFNGDGKDDILYYNSANGTLDVQTNAITNFNNLNTISQNIPSPSSWLNSTQNWLGPNTYLNQTGVQVQFGDVTGDGKLDAVVYVPGISNDNIYVAENNGGTGFILSSTPWSTFTHGNFDLLLGNLDASVTKDLILYNKTNGNIQVGLVSGSTFITPTTWATTTNASNWKFYVGNFTSNTEDDLVGYDYINGDLNIFQKTSGNSFTSSLWYHSQGLSLALTAPEVFVQPDLINCPLVVGDFNGDGQTDVMIYKTSFIPTKYNIGNGIISASELTYNNATTITPSGTTQGQFWMGYNNGNSFEFNLWHQGAPIVASNNYNFIVSDIYKDNRVDILCVDNINGQITLGINAPHVEGYCWPLSAAPGQNIDFKISGNGLQQVEIGKYTSYDNTLTFTPLVSPTLGTPFSAQYISELAWKNGCGWANSYSLIIQPNWQSGFYGAKLTSINGTIDYVSFIVKSATTSCSKILLLANSNTWQAYNGWCGSADDGIFGSSDWFKPNNDRRLKYSPFDPSYDQYGLSTVPETNFSTLSFFRPNPTARPDIIQSSTQTTDNSLSKLQQMNLRAELWTYTWLLQNGYSPDVITDIDLDASSTNINSYKTLIFGTHPEYWTMNMYDKVELFMSQGAGINGGNIISLGGNSIYEEAKILNSGIGSINSQLQFYNGQDNTNRHLFVFDEQNINKNTSKLIGVHTGNSFVVGSPYTIPIPSIPNPIFNNTASYTIENSGYNSAVGGNGAVGWEVDEVDNSTANPFIGTLQILGMGTGPAPIVYVPSQLGVNNHGFIFTAGSIYFGGSLIADNGIQNMMKNVLSIDLSPFISNITANTIPCGSSVGSITITPGSTNNYTFTLLPGGSTLSTNSTNPITFNGLSAGQYTVQASDVASGCTISAIVFLKAVTLTTTITNITCNSLTNGSIQAVMNNANGTINYTLNPGSITNTTGIYSNLGPGTYTVTAIDANSCSLSSTVTFTNPPVLSWGNPIIWGKDCNTATYNITVGANGGVSPYSYAINSTSSWNTVGIGDFIGALLGTNTFYCKDAYGCIISTSITTQNSSNLNWASVIANNINCNGGSGSINANVSGGIGSVNYKLLFYGVSNTSGLFTSLNAGTYFVEATDANGCIVTSVTITEPLPLVASATESRICGNTATINTSGGTSPINTYAISGPTGSTPSINSTGNATNITIVGIYTVTVIDALGCSTSTTLEKVNSDFCCQSLGVTLVQTPDVILLDNKNASDLISINGNNNIVDGKTIYINGVFTVTDDITFQNNCLIYFTPNAQIIVNAGKTIHIDNNSILQSACNTMWKGIVANDQSSKIRISDLSQLMNMESGVQCINGAQIDCQNSIFTDNYISIQLANSPAGYNNVNGNCIIRNNTFTSSGSALLAPYAIQSKSEIGIIVSKCEEVEIGILSTDPNEKNIFDGLFNGIFIIPSPMYVANDLKFYNNDFMNINDNVPTGAYHIGTIVNNTYTTHRGAGIFAQEFNNIPMGWSLTNLHKVTLSSIPSGAKFDGCDKAIALNYFGADVKGINTKNTLLGIMCNHTDRQEYVIGNAVSVNSNDPNSNSLNDVIIGMQFIGNSGKSDVNDNKITLNKNYYTIGNLGLLYYWAQGIVVKNYYSPPSLFEIIDNIITIPSIGGIGINLGNTGSGMFVNHNEMYFTTTDVTPSSIAIPADITGIKVSNAKGSELSENFIQGFITSGNTLNTLVFNARPAYGMDINKSSAMKISCNDIRNVRYGMQIVSDCNTGNDENFSGNRFHNHNFPLIFRHLGNEGTFGNIGNSVNSGYDCSNDFAYTPPPSGTPGGVFNINNWKVTRMSTIGTASFDKIYTLPSLLSTSESGGNNPPTYYTPVDNTGATTPNQCVTNNPFSQNGSEVGMDIDYAMLIAGDSIIYPEYADVSRWFDERRLFELLDRDSLLRNSYYYFLDFYNAQLLLPTDEIMQVDRLINDIMAANITDSADFTNRIAAIENLNNTILSGRGFENNERVINTYFIKWLTGGISAFTETEKEEIEAMAMSCPYVNGTAVYKARTIYASIDPGIDYNDLTICNAAGVYKNGGGKGLFDDENSLLTNMISGNGNTTNNHVNKSNNTDGVKLYPNPASDNITIDYRLNANEIAVLKIYDVIGRERMKIDLQPSANKVLVKINSLEPGVYSYRYSVNNIQNSTGKLIIE